VNEKDHNTPELRRNLVFEMFFQKNLNEARLPELNHLVQTSARAMANSVDLMGFPEKLVQAIAEVYTLGSAELTKLMEEQAVPPAPALGTMPQPRNVLKGGAFGR
jgi:hypothetical protein